MWARSLAHRTKGKRRVGAANTATSHSRRYDRDAGGSGPRLHRHDGEPEKCRARQHLFSRCSSFRRAVRDRIVDCAGYAVPAWQRQRPDAGLVGDGGSPSCANVGLLSAPYDRLARICWRPALPTSAGLARILPWLLRTLDMATFIALRDVAAADESGRLDRDLLPDPRAADQADVAALPPLVVSALTPAS